MVCIFAVNVVSQGSMYALSYPAYKRMCCGCVEMSMPPWCIQSQWALRFQFSDTQMLVLHSGFLKATMMRHWRLTKWLMVPQQLTSGDSRATSSLLLPIWNQSKAPVPDVCHITNTRCRVRGHRHCSLSTGVAFASVSGVAILGNMWVAGLWEAPLLGPAPGDDWWEQGEGETTPDLVRTWTCSHHRVPHSVLTYTFYWLSVRSSIRSMSQQEW